MGWMTMIKESNNGHKSLNSYNLLHGFVLVNPYTFSLLNFFDHLLFMHAELNSL